MTEEPTDGTRDRLLSAFAELIDERGYAHTSVVDIVRVARASKRTFYDHFPNKETAFVALLLRATDDLAARIRATVDPEAPWQDQVTQAVEAYAVNIEVRPAIALSWIRDLPALGAAARPGQRRNFATLTAMIIDLTRSPGFVRADIAPLSEDAATVLVGGLRELAARAVEDGRDIHSIVAPGAGAAIALLSHPGTDSF